MHNDIPEAQRQQVSSRKPASSPISPWMIGVGVVGGIGLLGGGWFALQSGRVQSAQTPDEAVVDPTASVVRNPNLFGHRPFEEVDGAELVPLSMDPTIQLSQAAATAFESMVYDAQGAGIDLVPLSGFRTKADQEYLFFKVKEKRNQNASQRADVSAPPGYSEHHTGFAIDIGDVNTPETHLEVTFANTPAFEWLKNNAARYSFELSFPEGNEQGISYEPWHWRFVGDQVSLETFHKKR